MPFNIAHITLTMRDGGGGLENLIVNMARSTDDEMFTITVGCLDHGGSLLHHIHEMHFDSFVVGRRPGIDWRLIFKLARIFSQRRIHIVHSHNQTAHFYAAIAGQLARVPAVIVTEHSRHNTELVWRRRLEKRFLYSLTDKWIVVSQELAEQSVEIDGLGVKKLQVIRNGVDFSHYNDSWNMDRQQMQGLKKQLNVPGNARLIIMVARLHPIKNHTVFLDALAAIHAELPDVHALLVGDGECREDLLRQCRELGLESTVHFLGFREDVAELLGLSDVFVLCSKTEGLPVSLLEACAARVPVLISRPSNKAGLIRNGANGIEFGESSRDLADGLLTIFNNPKKAQEMAIESSQQVKEDFSLTTMTKEYEAVYLEILAARGVNKTVPAGGRA